MRTKGMPASVSFHISLRGAFQFAFPRQRAHQCPHLKPDSLKDTVDIYLLAPLRVCNLLKHVDRAMSHVAVTPQGAQISVSPNKALA